MQAPCGSFRSNRKKRLYLSPEMHSDWTNVGHTSAGSGKKSACDAGDMDSIPGSGRSLGGGRGNPLQCSCLENLMDKVARQARVHRIAESDTAATT